MKHSCFEFVSCFVLRASCFAALLAIVFTAAIRGADTTSPRSQSQAQEQARALAGELVSSVLDLQLRQLKENGLSGLPVYRDIALMRENIDGLMRGEMEAIVQLLVEAGEGSAAARLEKLSAARGKIRETVVRLIAERQRLNRRMQVARLSADVRQIINLQTAASASTSSLPQLAQDERERAALAVIEDQADVSKLCYQLVESLRDVGTWGGEVAAGASAGLRILRAAQVEPQLKEAGQALAAAEYAAAASSQSQALKGLTALLERLDEAQGLSAGDRDGALRFVRELIDAQRDLREQTKQADLAERAFEPLIQRQTRLQKQLGKLAEALASFPTTQPLLEAAKAASFEATAGLFEVRKPGALDQQNRVIGSLAQIEKVLEQERDLTQSSKSADELAEEVQRLEELKQQLAAAVTHQSQAAANAERDPQQAASHQANATQELAKANALAPSSAAINAVLNDAKDEVTEAGAQLVDGRNESAELRKEAAEQAVAVLRQAQAEVESQHADARRRHKAVELGELARASEALERAVAAERTIARQAGDATSEQALNSVQATALLAEHLAVAQVAFKIYEGVHNTAPTASQMLAQARPAMEEAAQLWLDVAERPAESSKASALKAGELSHNLVRQLTAAAAELRVQAGRAGKELATIAGEQFTQAEAARQAVEKAIEKSDQTTAEAIASLALAKSKVKEALIEQAKAAGKGPEASAKLLVEQISQLARDQEEADRAAQDFALGKANNPLDAASQQQEVADAAAELAKQSPMEIVQPLTQVAKIAADAARETLRGNPARAQASRRLAEQSLAQALHTAQEMAEKARQSPAGPLDASAQVVAAGRTNEGQQLVSRVAAAAGQSATAVDQALSAARQYAAVATKNIENGDSAAALAAQQAATQSLTDAANKIDEAMNELANKQADALAKEAERAGELTDQAAQVDPGAAAALIHARRSAQLGIERSDRHLQSTHAQQEVSRNMQQAQANLAAREQQLRRDRDLAEKLATLAQEQQTARDAIDQAAKELEQSAPTNLPQQLAAAESLQQAQQQFAASLRAAGEGAAEVSGQQEIANQPIREGLETASRLNQVAQGDRGQEAGAKGQGTEGDMSLGTGLVPKSPEATAKQIAGPQANAAAAAAKAAAVSAKTEAQGEQPGQGESESPMPGETSATAKKGGATKKGQAAKNQKQQPGDPQEPTAADADSRGELADSEAALGNVRLQAEPWFAQLPPGVRAAIQAKSRGKPPRGYEERLRRYFESVD